MVIVYEKQLVLRISLGVVIVSGMAMWLPIDLLKPFDLMEYDP
jgi:hypothetical protein